MRKSGTQIPLYIKEVRPLLIKATGWQSREMCRMDKYGFPRTSAKQQSHVQGFRTGDMVRAVVTQGKKVGTYVGRVAVRTSGKFNVTIRTGIVQSIAARYCQTIHRRDGYSYAQQEAISLTPPNGKGIRRLSARLASKQNS